MRQVRTGLVMAVMGLTAALLTLSGCPKTPKTATQTAAVPGAEQPAPSPPVVEEVAPPIVAAPRMAMRANDHPSVRCRLDPPRLVSLIRSSCLFPVPYSLILVPCPSLLSLVPAGQ